MKVFAACDDFDSKKQPPACAFPCVLCAPCVLCGEVLVAVCRAASLRESPPVVYSFQTKGAPMPTTRINGADIFYKESGSGPEAIVFSHGLLMDHTMFDAQRAAFESRYRVIA